MSGPSQIKTFRAKSHTLASGVYGKGKNDPPTFDFYESQTCGEDAYFVTRTVVGVADGVGGWADLGVDCSAISRGLMGQAKSYVEQGEETDPRVILSNAYKRLVESQTVRAGSTTACVASLVQNPDFDSNHNTAFLQVANLGDSGAIVFRDGRILHKTKEQTLAFNTPYQLAIIPPSLRQGGDYILNTPEQADLYNFEVKSGDIVLLATDGVFDNLFPGDLEETLAHWTESTSDKSLVDQKKRNELAKSFVDFARQKASKRSGKSPFSVNAALYGYHYPGGKWDDCVVIVCFVEQAPISKM